MTAGSLLNDLRGRGVEIVATGDKLRVRPSELLTDQLRDEIRAHRTELVVLLRNQPIVEAVALIDAVWEARCRVIVAGSAAHIEPREPDVRVPEGLRTRLLDIEGEVVRALTRQPWGVAS